MALNDTIKHVRTLLAHITQDLEKADNGNKAAAQRVRTGTVKLEKIAKLYRKESIKNEKTGKKPAKKAASKAKKAPVKHAAPKAKKAPVKHAAHKKAVVKAKPKAKAHHAKAHKKAHHAKAHALTFKKKPTANLPTRRASAR